VRAPSDKVGNQPSTHASSPVYCTLLALRSTVGQYYFLSKQNILLARSTDIFFSSEHHSSGFSTPPKQFTATCGRAHLRRQQSAETPKTQRRANKSACAAATRRRRLALTTCSTMYLSNVRQRRSVCVRVCVSTRRLLAAARSMRLHPAIPCLCSQRPTPPARLFTRRLGTPRPPVRPSVLGRQWPPSDHVAASPRLASETLALR
jgi:hypothetical protein